MQLLGRWFHLLESDFIMLELDILSLGATRVRSHVKYVHQGFIGSILGLAIIGSWFGESRGIMLCTLG